MADKRSEQNQVVWYWRRADETQGGPIGMKAARELVLSGEIAAQTLISQNGKDWHPAVSCGELGFDCVVLDASDGLNVLGPFAREYIDRHDVMSGVPTDGILFVRGGTVGEALPNEAQGTTGAALVERMMAAERDLREGLKARRLAETALAAKDLEFDAERQKLNGVVSGLKADALKQQSEIDELRAEIERCEADKEHRAELAAKLVDAEHAAVRASAERDRHEKTSAERIQALTAQQAKEQATRETLERKLTEAETRLTASEARCVTLETELAANTDRVNTLAAQLAEQEEARTLLEGQLREASTWLRQRLSDFAGEVTERFDVGSCTIPVDGAEIEVIVPEVVREGELDGGATASYSVKLRSGRSGADAPPLAKLSALENQLKREISSLGAAQTEHSASPGHEGFINNVFKRRKTSGR